MSKRFGRNQRRAMREEVERQSYRAELAHAESDALGKAHSEMRRKLHNAQAALTSIAKELNPRVTSFASPSRSGIVSYNATIDVGAKQLEAQVEYDHRVSMMLKCEDGRTAVAIEIAKLLVEKMSVQIR